jgi:hypothetical protein
MCSPSSSHLDLYRRLLSLPYHRLGPVNNYTISLMRRSTFRHSSNSHYRLDWPILQEPNGKHIGWPWREFSLPFQRIPHLRELGVSCVYPSDMTIKLTSSFTTIAYTSDWCCRVEANGQITVAFRSTTILHPPHYCTHTLRISRSPATSSANGSAQSNVARNGATSNRSAGESERRHGYFWLTGLPRQMAK